MKNFIIAFILTLAFIAGLAWLGGFNFDTRSPDVAIATLLAVTLAFLTGVLVGFREFVA